MNDFFKALETKREGDISHFFAKKMEALPKDATAKDLDDAFTESIIDSANIYICAPKSSWKLKSGQPRKEARNDKIL